MNWIKNLKQYLSKLKKDNLINDLKIYQHTVHAIWQYNSLLDTKADKELYQLSVDLQFKASNGVEPNDLLIEQYALVIQAFKRTLNIIPFDVQILGAIVLHQGRIIEMQTGEGKTIVAVFAACLNALSKKGVHVLTFNDYLAKRDATWMKPVFDFLGLSVGFLQEGMSKEEKRSAYHCDVTYSTAKEIGFDYLRECMAYSSDDIVMRDFNYAIVDEADALLIDEARNPLVLAGNIDDQGYDPYFISSYTNTLIYQQDYLCDEYHRNVFLTERGIKKAENFFHVNDFHNGKNNQLFTGINLALQAKVLLQKDVDYIVEEGKVKLVDEFTGRIVEERKWQNGLQSAVEAKEGLVVQTEGRILNSITLQHFMSFYKTVSGMTGTAKEAREEFKDFYNLAVTQIPPNKPTKRIDYPDRVFTHKAAKMNALVEEVRAIHGSGRPILIGTLNVRESEELHSLLDKNGISCIVLNAKNNELEASIIENAGNLEVVTISTNMAGRGTDILLGGKDSIQKEKLLGLGGLHIIGTNRHESLRIDNQLRGRSGRQGEPGTSQFIISMEDDMMVKYNLKSLLPKKYRNYQQETEINKLSISKSISQAQRIIEGQQHYIRQTLFRYSSFIEAQRKIVLGRRQSILYSKNTALTQARKEYLLFHYDVNWSYYLSEINAIKEGIYLERIAGRDPLREFYQKADEVFKELVDKLDIVDVEVYHLEDNDLTIKRPSSVYTYLVEDYPFQNTMAAVFTNFANLKF